MNRNEQIAQACARERSVSEERAFTRGALWADRNPADRWISVEDALPDESIDVATINKAGFTGVRYRYRGKWFSKYGNEHRDITHWMLLPEKPRKESER